jgi:hypothetical protein
MLAVFQIITFDNWTQIMYNLMDSSDYIMAIVFCISLIIFGSFFLINLILAVIMQNFNKMKE